MSPPDHARSSCSRSHVAGTIVLPVTATGARRYSERTMKMLRRAILALSAAATVAGILRLRGQGGVPPQTGGWRELSTRPR